MKQKQVIQQLLDKAVVQIDGSQPGDILVHNDATLQSCPERGLAGTG